MGRIRTIKPEFFLHEGLFDLELETGMPMRIAYVGLWTQADREGRFKWRPRRLKAAILPYDDVDFAALLDRLEVEGYLQRYDADGCDCGVIVTFLDHQMVNNRERASMLPEPPHAPPSHSPRKGREGKGKERKGRAPRDDDASRTRASHVDAIYSAYIRKRAPKNAKRAIAKALDSISKRESSNTFEWLLSRTKLYSESVSKWPAADRGDGDKFIPHPATWFNGECYDEDPETWKRGSEPDDPYEDYKPRGPMG